MRPVRLSVGVVGLRPYLPDFFDRQCVVAGYVCVYKPPSFMACPPIGPEETVLSANGAVAFIKAHAQADAQAQCENDHNHVHIDRSKNGQQARERVLHGMTGIE